VFCNYIEPLFALVLFALPAVFAPQTDVFRFPTLTQGAVFVIFGAWFLYRLRQNSRPTPKKLQKTRNAVIAFSTLALLFLFLCLFTLMQKTIAYSRRVEYEMPVWLNARNGIASYALLFVLITIAASFEEIFFRGYLVERLRYFTHKIFAEKTAEAAAETSALILFALAHQSGGVFAVLNALASGTALKVCYRKTRSILVIAAVHAAYNIAIFMYLHFFRG